MPQLFSPGADALFRLALVSVVGTVAVGLFVAARVTTSSYATQVGVAPNQPVPFSHKHHSGELGIDCRYCHTAVETQASAGIPPTHTCMSCHSQIWTGSPMLAPVRESLANDQPLVWNRINRLPGYTYFNHAIHVAKGVGCSSCHGPVDTMQLTYAANGFKMQFCLDCHRHPEEYVRPKDQIWNMEWTAPDNQASLGKALVAQYHISGPGRLTDCSICHR